MKIKRTLAFGYFDNNWIKKEQESVKRDNIEKIKERESLIKSIQK